MRHSPVATQSFGGLAFSNIRIQDPNTFLCAENAMNVQARESVCHGKNCIVGQNVYNINVFSFSIQNSLTPIIESVRTPARITPYPTGRLGSLGWRCPRHFVPGYDRTVPPGHFATGSLQELAFGTQRADRKNGSSYNSFAFSMLCRQFLESTPLGLRHLLRERNFSSGRRLWCNGVWQSRRRKPRPTDQWCFEKPVGEHGSFGFAVRALVRPGSDP